MSSSTTAPKLPTVITETLPVVADATNTVILETIYDSVAAPPMLAAPPMSLPDDSNTQVESVAATSVVVTTEVATSVVATQSRYTICPVCSQYIFIPTANAHVMKCLAATI